MLFWAAVLNGLLAPPLVIIILVICNDRTIMREYRNGPVLNVLGGITALVMTLAALGTVIGWIRG
jgi:Mn2+/Fe2+ NRAMP family transporter